MVSVGLRDVSRIHADGVRALSHVDLDIAAGERLAVLGPSGAGKSTLLRVVAGLEPADEGHVVLDGQVVDEVPAGERGVGYVFQSAALYPHLDVAGNLGFPHRLRGARGAELDDRVEAEAGALGLRRLLRRRPRTLSAGHRQTVALARATGRLPAVLCLDEPLSDVDTRERVRLRREIVRLQQGLGTTLLHVSNDRVEAMAVGERVAVLRRGRLEQVDEPTVLHDRPASPFVAAFVGDAALLSAVVTREGDTWWITAGRHRLRFAGTPPFGPVADGSAVVLGLRPDQLADARIASRYPADRRLRARVRRVERLGDQARVTVALDATAVSLADEPIVTGRGEATVVARLPADTDVRADDLVELAVDLRTAHVFDPATGRPLG